MRTVQVARRCATNAAACCPIPTDRSRQPHPHPRRGAGGAVHQARPGAGFTLAEIEVLLDLAEGGPDSCKVAQQLATEQISELDGKIARLVAAMRDSVDALRDTCTRPCADRECPLMHSVQPTVNPDVLGVTATDRPRSGPPSVPVEGARHH